jgi:hypothetical protein
VKLILQIAAGVLLAEFIMAVIRGTPFTGGPALLGKTGDFTAQPAVTSQAPSLEVPSVPRPSSDSLPSLPPESPEPSAPSAPLPAAPEVHRGPVAEISRSASPRTPGKNEVPVNPYWRAPAHCEKFRDRWEVFRDCVRNALELPR